ncbi:MAG: hypothetical protein NC416_10340 [Eubacterium sp.]|nr:hypothetical protein [Eubacterium sp.]
MKEIEIFLVFRLLHSNFGTWMSRKARIAHGCALRAVASGITAYTGMLRKSIRRNPTQENFLCNLPSQLIP